MIKYARDKKLPETLISSMRVEILNLGPKINIYDEKLFTEYASKPSVKIRGHSDKVWGSRDSTWDNYLRNVQCKKSQDNQHSDLTKEITETFLEHFYT